MKASCKFVAAIALGVGVLVTNASAVTVACPSPYVVRPGDNLWSLAQVKLQDPRKWVELERQNPILSDWTRYSTDGDGRLIVLIKPGEVLCGLEAAGIKPDDFGATRPPTLQDVPWPPQPVEVTGSRVNSERAHDNSMPWWGWLILALATLLLGGAFTRWMASREERKLEADRASRAVNNNPATAGPPMVPGGVNEANADQTLREMAVRRYGGAHQDFTILDRTVGQVHGNMYTAYRDGTERLFEMTGERAYQARIRHQNGHEEVVYMLKACGNDLRFGGVAGYRHGDGFRFVPDVVEETTAAQSVAEATVALALVPAPAPAPVVGSEVLPAVEVMTPGTVRVKVEPAGDRGPNLVKVSGVNPVGASIEVTPNGFELRYANLANQATNQTSDPKVA